PIGHLDPDLGAAATGRDAHAAAVCNAQAAGVVGIHAQRARGVLLPPAGVADDGVRRERASLAGGEQGRERGARSGWRLGGEAVELIEELRYRELDVAVRRTDAGEVLRPLVDREHDRALAREERVEERVACISRLAGEAGARERPRVALRRD